MTVGQLRKKSGQKAKFTGFAGPRRGKNNQRVQKNVHIVNTPYDSSFRHYFVNFKFKSDGKVYEGCPKEFH